MEEILRNLKISEDTINQMIEICPDITELTKEEVINKIEILKNIGCADYQICNIISSNVNYLDKSNADVINLINKLKEIGFDNLDLLFDGNPYILNLDDFEIERYINSQIEKGEKIENIIDLMSSDLAIFDEI